MAINKHLWSESPQLFCKEGVLSLLSMLGFESEISRFNIKKLCDSGRRKRFDKEVPKITQWDEAQPNN